MQTLLCGLVDALISESNIVAHAARKQKHILLHDADAFAQFLCVPLLYFYSIHEYFTALDGIETAQEVDDRGLARSPSLQPGQALASFDAERYVLQNPIFRLSIILEVDVFKLNCAAALLKRSISSRPPSPSVGARSSKMRSDEAMALCSRA